MIALLEKLTNSPKLHLYIQELQAFINDEATKRQAFYEQITEDDKAEFINGQIVMHSPVMRMHNRVSVRLTALLSMYVTLKELGEVGVEKCMIALTRNSYEPDICFFGKEKSQHFTPEQMLFPAPDFVVEILSKSTAKNDRTIKFEDYEAHGVTEYWIINSRPTHEYVEQYVLDSETKKYQLQLKSSEGWIYSAAVSGFAIPIRALFEEVVYRHALVKIGAK